MTVEELRSLLKSLSATEVNLAQLQIMALAYKADEPPTMTQAARESCHTTAAATGSIDHLERKGFALRIRDDKDRRIVRFALTQKGESLFSKLLKELSVN